MIKKLPSQIWFPFWVDKWIWGSMRLEFSPPERALWIDLQAIAAKDDGFIRANEDTPYLAQQLAGMLVYDEAFFSGTIERFIAAGKIDRDKNGILYISNWEKYAASPGYKRVLKHRLEKEGVTFGVTDETESVTYNKTEQNITKQNIKDIVIQIIDYLNERTGKKFSTTAENTVKLISGRLSEGRTLTDFKQVIDVKVAKWRGDPKMDDYLRPDTLFRPSNFESYLNEKPTRPPVGQNTKPASSKEEQFRKEFEAYRKDHASEDLAAWSQKWWEEH